jgi:hypothetical protein
MRRTNGARQGRNRKAGFRLSRISDAVLRRLDKQKCSSIYWASSITPVERGRLAWEWRFFTFAVAGAGWVWYNKDQIIVQEICRRASGAFRRHEPAIVRRIAISHTKRRCAF